MSFYSYFGQRAHSGERVIMYWPPRAEPARPTHRDKPSEQGKGGGRQDGRAQPRDPSPFVDDADLPVVSTRRPLAPPRSEGEGK